MTLIPSSLQNEIDDLTRRHTTFKQKWLEKQRNISNLLASAVVACRTSANDIHLNEQQILPSDTIDDSQFERLFIDYLIEHAPISITNLAHIFSKEDEQILNLLKNLKIKLDIDGKTVLPLRHIEPSSDLTLSKSLSSPSKYSLPSWMGLPPRRGSLSRERPSHQLVHLLSHLTVREYERENFNVEMDRLLNRQTAMEKMLSRRYRTNDTIQEYCQYTTRDDCPLANSHLHRRSRSSSTSSDPEQKLTDDDLQAKKKRKRDDSNDLNESTKRSSYYHRKNINTCGKVHFRRLIKPHTDEQLGDCSFLNTCFHMETCKYIHYQIDKTNFVPASNINNKTNRHLPIVERISPGSVPPQWVQCDLRQLDMAVLGKFSVIMADPPWDIHMELPYGTMADEEMRRLDIPSLQDDGYIFLWVTGRAMELGRECLRIWGYQRCDEVIWVKTNQLQRIIRTGRTGHWLNHGKEHCLVGVKGSCVGVNRGLDSDVIVAEVRATSRKPDEIYGMIERLSPRTRKIEFFTRGDIPTYVVDSEEGVLFVHYPDGRSTGDAFVMVKTENEAAQALLKHKDIMGTRYIELFRSTTAEVQQVFRRSQDPKNFQTSLKDIPFAPLPILPPEMLTGGNKKDCIRVRNLPVECGIEQILEFLGVHSQHIVAQGVHMVYNAHGQPSGEAFIQMDSEAASYNAATHKNNKYMFFNGKKKYIEILQCSGEDMNHILLGLVPSNLIPQNIQRQPMYSPHRAQSLVPISTLQQQMLPPSMPISLATSSQQTNISNGSLSSAQSSTSSASTVNGQMTTAAMNGLHPNATYYPMQVFYYPTPPISPSIYLQTGHMHPGPVTLVLRGDNGQY
ncbi:unnamed protein product [Adineta steineri]|uniref:mRNA m(6)A methyltransferase n=1 Tax=Adineta steineri TaxID=433720 RepID=A0A813N8I7_9BILA|nr:unnamed protein product [Adineta steineri]